MVISLNKKLCPKFVTNRCHLKVLVHWKCIQNDKGNRYKGTQVDQLLGIIYSLTTDHARVLSDLHRLHRSCLPLLGQVINLQLGAKCQSTAPAPSARCREMTELS